MRIPDDKVEEVRAASDVVDVVSDYVQLKKRGSNYFGLCPFHNEKTPSFSVNPAMGIYKCFGCHAGGDVFRFVMQVEGLGFIESIRLLAERAGIPLPEQDAEERERASEVESIYHALRFAARFFYEQLTRTDAGRPALDYLHARGFPPKTIKRFGLGYAPDRWDALLTAAEAQHIAPEMLEKAGLVLPRKDGSGHYDRFRGRVIFPIFSHVGKVLGFGGRILAPDPDQPKYINSPETKVYTKSQVLYGLYQAKQEARREEEVILVEGYTDVISLHQAGVENVVASSGTALTAEQVKALGRYVKRILLLYDADAAGAEAALRGIDLVLEQGLAAYAVALPGGEDPDSYVRTHGGEAFREYARKHRQDFVVFLYESARRAGRLDTPEGEAATMRAVLATVARIPDPLAQETYLRRASEVLGVPDMQLRPVLADLQREQHQQQARAARREEARAALPEAPPLEAYEDAPEAQAAPPPAEVWPQEAELLRLMLQHGAPMIEFILSHMALDEFSEGPPRTLAAALLQMFEDGAVETRRFFDGSFGADVQALAAEVVMERHEPSDNWQRKQNITVGRADPFESARSAMRLLKLRRVDAAIAAQKERLYAAPHADADDRALQEHLMHLLQLRQGIDRREFLDW